MKYIVLVLAIFFVVGSFAMEPLPEVDQHQNVGGLEASSEASRKGTCHNCQTGDEKYPAQLTNNTNPKATSGDSSGKGTKN